MTQASGVARKRGKFQMKGHRTKKVAPVNMKKQEHQFVIDGYMIKEVLDQIPADINIIQAKVSVYTSENMKNQVVPNKSKKFGVQKIRVSNLRKEMNFVFDNISKTALIKNVTQGCKEENMPFEKAFFSYIVLSNGSGKGRFDHCTKEVNPDETDLRKKLRVLGITSGEGKIQELLSQLGAKKYYCTIKEEPVKFMMCSRE